MDNDSIKILLYAILALSVCCWAFRFYGANKKKNNVPVECYKKPEQKVYKEQKENPYTPNSTGHGLRMSTTSTGHGLYIRGVGNVDAIKKGWNKPGFRAWVNEKEK